MASSDEQGDGMLTFDAERAQEYEMKRTGGHTAELRFVVTNRDQVVVWVAEGEVAGFVVVRAEGNSVATPFGLRDGLRQSGIPPMPTSSS